MTMHLKLSSLLTVGFVALVFSITGTAQSKPVETIQVNQSSLLQSADNAMRAGKVEKSIELYEASLATPLTQAQQVIAHNNLCIALQVQGDLDGAIDHCSQALAIDPQYWRAYNNRGNAYFEGEHYRNAELDYQAALSLNPGSDAIAENLTNVRYLVATND